MKLPEFGVTRPIATSMLFIMVLVLGVICFSKLGVDLTPEIEPTRVTVMTTWEGASAEDVESKVTRVLEKRLGSVSNLDEIRSTTREGVSNISCTFTWGTNIDEASNDVRSKVDMAKDSLPDDADTPTIFKFDSADMPILLIGVTARESIEKLYDIIDDEVAQPLQRIEGVGSVNAFGGLQRQINIVLSREKLSGYGLTLDDITKAIANENRTLPAGSLKISRTEYTIRVLGEFDDPMQVQEIPVLRNQGKLLRIKDFAEVTDGFKEITQYVETMGRDGMMMIVQKRTGANTVKVCAEVLKELENLKHQLPQDIEFYVINDSSDFISNSIRNVRGTVLWGGLFVILVSYFFLRSIRSSLVIALTIPFSIIIAFCFMYFMGWTINMISLSALSIAVGMVVDNAIVVLENITSHISRGVRVKEAAMFAAGEVGLSLVASTATTICVFLPLVFVQGATGIMFKQLGGLVTATLLASMLCALLLTPMLASRLLKRRPAQECAGTERSAQECAGTEQSAQEFAGTERPEGIWARLYSWSEKLFLAIEQAYGWFLGHCLKHRYFVLICGAAVIALAILAIPFVGTEFTPDQDLGEMEIQFQLPVSTRSELTAAMARRITNLVYAKEKELMETKYAGQSIAPDDQGRPRASGIRFNNWRAGSSSWGRSAGSHIGRINIKLLKRELRPYASAELGDAVLSELRTWPELDRVFLSTSNRLMSMILGGSNEKPIIVNVLGYDLQTTLGIANRIRQLALQIPGCKDPTVTFDSGNRELVIEIDRAAAAALNVSVNAIVSSIRTLFYGSTASKFRQSEDEYDIFLQLREDERRSINDLQNSEITVNGKRIRLDAVATIHEALGPLSISRIGQERVVYLQMDVYDRSLGEVFADLKQSIEDNLSLPQGVSLAYTGQVKEQGKSFNDLTLMLVLGILLVYMVMAAEFESHVAPFVVMFSIPFAFAGAVFMLLFAGFTLNMFSFIGLIMLVGTVVNNAIVLVDYINLLIARGNDVYTAVTSAGRQRLRPVLMTTMTTCCGMLPMALSKSTGSELWSPLATTIIGGLMISTIVTLAVIPTIYSFVLKPKEA
ncbi:MAG: efflux RND transporter permease subunit [Victivallales bacterium]|nr:efflux RND transporter permease subunit [Victivallales bacterium]